MHCSSLRRMQAAPSRNRRIRETGPDSLAIERDAGTAVEVFRAWVFRTWSLRSLEAYGGRAGAPCLGEHGRTVSPAKCNLKFLRCRCRSGRSLLADQPGLTTGPAPGRNAEPRSCRPARVALDPAADPPSRRHALRRPPKLLRKGRAV